MTQQQWEVEQAAKAIEIAALQAANPTLIAGRDLVTAAKNMRTQLRAAFPGVKFSVRGANFAGGDSITVGWEDGPTQKQVDAVVDRHQGGHFDGRIDYYVQSEDLWPEAFGRAKFVHTRREKSDRLIARAIDRLAQRYGVEEADRPTSLEFSSGSLRDVSPVPGAPKHDPEWTWNGLIRRECADLAA